MPLIMNLYPYEPAVKPDPRCKHRWEDMVPLEEQSSSDEEYRICPNSACPSRTHLGGYYDTRLTTDGKIKVAQVGAIVLGGAASLTAVLLGFGRQKSGPPASKTPSALPPRTS